MISTYCADKIFTGTEWIQNAAVVCENGLIKDLANIENLRVGTPG